MAIKRLKLMRLTSYLDRSKIWGSEWFSESLVKIWRRDVILTSFSKFWWRHHQKWWRHREFWPDISIYGNLTLLFLKNTFIPSKWGVKRFHTIIGSKIIEFPNFGLFHPKTDDVTTKKCWRQQKYDVTTDFLTKIENSIVVLGYMPIYSPYARILRILN